MAKREASDRPNARHDKMASPGAMHRHMSAPGLSPNDLLALYSAPGLQRFIDEAFRVLPELVRCDYVSVFYQRAGEGFLRERDSRGRVWNRAFMRRYVELTPAIRMAAENPGIRILATRDTLIGPDEELHRTAFYREVMRPQGWRHGAVLCFWAEPATAFPILVLALYRTEHLPDFSDEDLARLDHLYMFLAPAVSRFHRLSVSNAIALGVATALRHVARGTVVLDWRLRVVHSNLAGRQSCAEWNEQPVAPQRGRPTVPSCLLQACDELRDQMQSTLRQHAPRGNAQRRRHIVRAGLIGLAASVTVICPEAAIVESSFVIEFHDSNAPPALAVSQASQFAQLTAAEREVAVVVAQGLTNEEAAERLGKTIHAVKFLLHRVYQKLNVSNRTRLCLLFRELTSS